MRLCDVVAVVVADDADGVGGGGVRFFFAASLLIRARCSYHDWQAGNRIAQFSSYAHPFIIH